MDQLQHLTERRDQLASSLTSAQTALRTAQGRVEQLQREMMEPGEIMSDTELAALEEESCFVGTHAATSYSTSRESSIGSCSFGDPYHHATKTSCESYDCD